MHRSSLKVMRLMYHNTMPYQYYIHSPVPNLNVKGTGYGYVYGSLAISCITSIKLNGLQWAGKKKKTVISKAGKLRILPL